ncbi:MAG: tRNA dihydrouridine synthase DusB [Candidatus Marinimicrobia bacterium]|nr:tRNA dihydrouridine synthase DusB [Candidatus Neomarinimicrobiota bacterium]|tara:strand:- start:1075 stop:2049 length:975 start_codon:yes stop_codon:yes gene_type:complete
MLKIGNLKIKNPLFLAPMAGVTDHPFRLICKKFGAGVVYTEFVSANGIIRENIKTLDMMRFSEEERPLGIQIFGDDPEVVGKSAKMVNEMFKPDIIDINYGCPVPKVTKSGAGSGAMKNLCLMDEITSAVIESTQDTPVTVKMRAGWDQDRIISTEAGLRLEKIGVKAITLHPRTTSQKFTGKSNWNLIKELKEAVKIPVIGNGDINCLDDYKRIIDTTGCDGAMIARGALGNPWIFKEIKSYILNEKIEKNISLKDRFNLCKQHYQLLKKDKTQHVCLNLTKKHFSWYLKGFNGASDWRKKFMYSQSVNEIEENLENFEKYVS